MASSDRTGSCRRRIFSLTWRVISGGALLVRADCVLAQQYHRRAENGLLGRHAGFPINDFQHWPQGDGRDLLPSCTSPSSARSKCFSSYQSDGMLLEAGFITFFFAPNGLRPDLEKTIRRRVPAGSFCCFLVFRIYFESGVAKILSGDPQLASPHGDGTTTIPTDRCRPGSAITPSKCRMGITPAARC